MLERWRQVDLSPEEIEREIEVYGGLADSIRALGDATVLTTLPEDEVAEIRQQVDALVARLASSRIEEDSYGVRVAGHRVLAHGNATLGARNPHAVPLRVEQDPDGRAHARFRLGAVYEGPPGLVHGGVVALVLDEVMGHAASAAGRPGMTGTLTVRYERATPLGECEASAKIERIEGVKAFVEATFGPAGEEPSVRAQGVFITPRWARDGASAWPRPEQDGVPAGEHA